VEVPKDVKVKQLIAKFGFTTNAIAVVVNVEQVIKVTPRCGRVLFGLLLCKILS
jgi:hypothetical protein